MLSEQQPTLLSVDFISLPDCQCPTQTPLLDKDGTKRPPDGKLRYKKLKQKLNALSEQVLDQGLLKDQRDITSPNKSRLMKLALELEKALRTQAIEYPLVESLMKEIQKIVEHRREHDLLILRGARIMGTLSAIVRRFPSLHKNQAAQSLPALEASLKLMRVMLALASSRQAFIVSNQMPAVSSLLSCALMRDQRRIAVSCLHLLNQIMSGPNRVELHPLLTTNIQYMLCSTLLKRLRSGLQSAIQQDDPSSAQFLLLGFKFYHLIVIFSCQNQCNRPIYSLSNNVDSLAQAISGYFQSGIQMLTLCMVELVYEKEEGEEKYMYREEDLPNFKISILLFIFKTLNTIFNSNVVYAQQSLQCSAIFLKTLLFIFEFAKQNFRQNVQTKNLCSQIIIFIGNLSFENFTNQQKIRTSGLLESLCNHPIEYLMEAPLRNYLVPTFCCLIHENPANFKQAFSENSVQPILNYIQKEISLLTEKLCEEQVCFQSGKNVHCRTMSRKTSVSSINSSYSKASISESYSLNNHNQIGQMRLEHRFRPQYWQLLVEQLKKIDD